MAKFIYGKHITTIPDVLDLVVSIIFKLEDSYTSKDLLLEVQKHLEGSKLKLSEKKLMEIVEQALKISQGYDVVTCCNGKYKTTSIQKTIISKTSLIFSEEEKLNLGI